MLFVSFMEIFELRYFVSVAQNENIHRASEKLHVSPAALSKAVARLESELGVKLFVRLGRNIKLSAPGLLLQQKATEMLRLEAQARFELGKTPDEVQVVMAGSEILLAKFGLPLTRKLESRYPLFQFEARACDDEAALQSVQRGEAHFAILTAEVPKEKHLTVKTLAEIRFQTFVGRGHPLYAAAKLKKSVTVEELLKHEFASLTHPLLGRMSARQSLDGWRDDQFPRKLKYLTSSLTLLEAWLSSGKARRLSS